MAGRPLSCVLPANRHHDLTDGMRGLLDTGFGPVVMVAADVLQGDMALAHWDPTNGRFLLDAREPVEAAGRSGCLTFVMVSCGP